MTTFIRERWSLHVTFDPYHVQAEGEMYHVLGELAHLEEHILSTFGGLPEEYGESVRSTGDGSVEITSQVVDYLATVMEWILNYTIPKEMKLVRNDFRR